MCSRWEKFVEEVVDEAGLLVKEEVRQLLDMAATDTGEFLRRQVEKIENYLDQLAEGRITKEQIEGYLLDIKDLIDMHVLKLSVVSRVKAQRLAIGITEIILDKLLAFF